MPADSLVLRSLPSAKVDAMRGENSGRRTISSQSKRNPGCSSKRSEGDQRSSTYAPVSKLLRSNCVAGGKTLCRSSVPSIRNNENGRSPELVEVLVVKIEPKLQLMMATGV